MFGVPSVPHRSGAEDVEIVEPILSISFQTHCSATVATLYLINKIVAFIIRIYSDSQVDVDEPLFQPEPHVIQFTNYEPLQVKEQILRLR